MVALHCQSCAWLVCRYPDGACLFREGLRGHSLVGGDHAHPVTVDHRPVVQGFDDAARVFESPAGKSKLSPADTKSFKISAQYWPRKFSALRSSHYRATRGGFRGGRRGRWHLYNVDGLGRHLIIDLRGAALDMVSRLSS